MLLEVEAESVRSSIVNAVRHVKTFYEEVADYTTKLMKVVDEIEGIVHSLLAVVYMQLREQCCIKTMPLPLIVSFFTSLCV